MLDNSIRHFLFLSTCNRVVDVTGDSACDYKLYDSKWWSISMCELTVLALALLFGYETSLVAYFSIYLETAVVGCLIFNRKMSLVIGKKYDLSYIMCQRH